MTKGWVTTEVHWESVARESVANIAILVDSVVPLGEGDSRRLCAGMVVACPGQYAALASHQMVQSMVKVMAGVARLSGD